MSEKPEEVQPKSGGGMQTQLAVTMAQALAEIAAGVRYLVAFGQRMQENDRTSCFRWRTSVPGSQSFSVDHPVKYWSVYCRSLTTTGIGALTFSLLGDSAELDTVDLVTDHGPGFGIIPAGKMFRIRTDKRMVSLRALAGCTLADTLIVAHNGGYELE